MSSDLLIYTPKITSRINYALSLFFESLIITPYKVTTDIEEYKNYNGPRLNYSGQAVADNEIFIHYKGLLFDNGVSVQNIKVSEWEGLKIFYQSPGTMPFDVFAASFYLVSRYEEYLPHEGDKHGRFKHADSLAFKNQFIKQPLVNLWAEKLKSILQKTYPAIIIKENTYTFTPTIDIDVAYAHKGRKLYVTIGAYLRALLNFDFRTISNKTKTLFGSRPDGYDTYDYQQQVFKKYNLNPIYFFLAGKRGDYDKNINVESKDFSDLVKKVSGFADVAIHPSYSSLGKTEMVKEEIKKLEDKLGNKITKSRQHFLRILWPDTFRGLASSGITDDYTLCYAGTVGFRASICTPFFFYDLQKEEILPLKLHSSAVMDGTLNEYMFMSPDEAIDITKKLIEQVKQVKGEFVGIWHNDSLNDKGKWMGWTRVFETIVAEAK